MQLRHAIGAMIVAISSPAWACDLCAVYSAAEAQGQAPGFFAALSEQFTRYDQLRDQGHRIDADGGQHLDSSVTQLVLGYGFDADWSVQIAVPYIQRWFKRPADGAIETGTESGIGDLTLTGAWVPYRHQSERTTLSLRAFAGLKLPTGNSDRLSEELNEAEEEPAPGEPVSGIHGHDLALGSGSTDFLLGGSAQARAGRWLATADLQYALRRRGDFDYRFGDDLQWGAAAGRYFILADDTTLDGLLQVEGEYKWYDDLAGERLGDTHCGHLLLGPRLQWTHGGRYSLDATALLPVQQFNSEIQTTAGYRVRIAFGYRF